MSGASSLWPTLGKWLITLAMAVGLLLTVVMVWMWALNLDTDAEVNFGNEAGRLVLCLSGLVFAVVGWLITSRRAGNRVGVVALGIGISLILSTFAIDYAIYSTLTAPGSLPGGDLLGWLGNFFWVVPIGLMAIVLVLVYPDGRLLSPRWRWVLTAAVGGMAAAGVFFALNPGPLVSLPWIENPFGVAGARAWIEFFSLGFFLMVAMVPLAAWSLRRRYVRAQGVARNQIKWFAAAAFLIALTYVGQFVFSVATDTLEGGSAIQRWVQTLSVAGFGALGASVGIAILKHRLYDIDKIISRTLSHGVVIALLGAVFFGVIAVSTAFLPSDDPLVVAIATLAAAALFDPLRRRVHSIVDRRFNRSHFDAQRVVEAFSSGLRETGDVGRIVDGWVGVVSETMQPASVSVWLRRP